VYGLVLNSEFFGPKHNSKMDTPGVICGLSVWTLVLGYLVENFEFDFWVLYLDEFAMCEPLHMGLVLNSYHFYWEFNSETLTFNVKLLPFLLRV
jgi:hypothetical protein